MDDYGVVPKVQSDDPELNIKMVLCNIYECTEHPVLKSQKFCKEQMCKHPRIQRAKMDFARNIRILNVKNHLLWIFTKTKKLCSYTCNS